MDRETKAIELRDEFARRLGELKLDIQIDNPMPGREHFVRVSRREPVAVFLIYVAAGYISITRPNGDPRFASQSSTVDQALLAFKQAHQLVLDDHKRA